MMIGIVTAESNFNPRTHVGCDMQRKRDTKDFSYFNPRTHVGCDPTLGDPHNTHLISIHAPTWGATPTL